MWLNIVQVQPLSSNIKTNRGRWFVHHNCTWTGREQLHVNALLPYYQYRVSIEWGGCM